MARRGALAILCVAACGGGPKMVDVGGGDTGCIADADRFCDDPPALLQVEAVGEAQVLLVGTGHGALHRLVGASDGISFTGDTADVATVFSTADRFLFCDLDGQDPRELVISRRGRLDPGTLLWEGWIADATETRSSRMPGPLLGAACADVDGDGVADLVGTSNAAALQIFPGGPDGFAATPISIPEGLAPDPALDRADVVGVGPCTLPQIAVASDENGSEQVHVIAFDVPTAEIRGHGIIDLGAPIRSLRLDTHEDGAALLVVATDDDPATLAFFSPPSCGLPFDAVGALTLHAVRRVHPLVGPTADFLVLGDEHDGIQLVQARRGEAPVVAKSWSIDAIDAQVVQFTPDAPPELVVVLAEPPYLQRLPF